jgi:hypothetical protein
MPGRPDWRSSSTAEALDRLNRAGFAWEFLRRNPEYQGDYNNLSLDAEETDPAAIATGVRWGLCFCMRPRATTCGRAGALAAGAPPPQCHSRSRTG